MLLDGKRVLITGGTGSLGSALFAEPGSAEAEYDLKTFGPRGPIPYVVHAEEVRIIGVVSKWYALARNFNGRKS